MKITAFLFIALLLAAAEAALYDGEYKLVGLRDEDNNAVPVNGNFAVTLVHKGGVTYRIFTRIRNQLFGNIQLLANGKAFCKAGILASSRMSPGIYANLEYGFQDAVGLANKVKRNGIWLILSGPGGVVTLKKTGRRRRSRHNLRRRS